MLGGLRRSLARRSPVTGHRGTRERQLTKRLVVSVCVATQCATAVSAQDAAYVEQIERYRRGDIIAAVAAAANWSEDDLRKVARDVSASTAPGVAKAAVLLHTEVAFALRPDRLADRHVAVAQQLAGRLPRSASSSFLARWRVLAATYQVMRGDLRAARLELNRAVGKGDHSRHAELMIAALQELAIRLRARNLRDRWSSPVLESDFRGLVAAYARVAAAYPDFLGARLRWGWALYLNHSGAGREHLAHVATRASRPDLQYLAHLFLGALAEREQRLEEALHEYEAAIAAVPHQSALLGVIAVAGAQGEPALVQRTAQALRALPAGAGDDPWTYYNAGVTGDEVLESLRAEVRDR